KIRIMLVIIRCQARRITYGLCNLLSYGLCGVLPQYGHGNVGRVATRYYTKEHCSSGLGRGTPFDLKHVPHWCEAVAWAGELELHVTLRPVLTRLLHAHRLVHDGEGAVAVELHVRRTDRLPHACAAPGSAYPEVVGVDDGPARVFRYPTYPVPQLHQQRLIFQPSTAVVVLVVVLPVRVRAHSRDPVRDEAEVLVCPVDGHRVSVNDPVILH